MFRITIFSKKLVADWAKNGVIPNKSHKTYFPDISEEFHSHFIRGVFDGDGCIYVNKANTPSIIFSGNYELLKTIQKIINTQCKILHENKIHKVKTTNTIVYGGTNIFIKIRNYMYKDATVFLNRKFLKSMLIKKKYANRDCLICKIKDLPPGKIVKNMCKKCYDLNFKNKYDENIN